MKKRILVLGVFLITLFGCSKTQNSEVTASTQESNSSTVNGGSPEGKAPAEPNPMENTILENTTWEVVDTVYDYSNIPDISHPFLGMIVTYTKDKIIAKNIKSKEYTGDLEFEICRMRREIRNENDLKRYTTGAHNAGVSFKDIGAKPGSTIEFIHLDTRVTSQPFESLPFSVAVMWGLLYLVDEETLIAYLDSCYYVMKRKK